MNGIDTMMVTLRAFYTLGWVKCCDVGCDVVLGDGGGFVRIGVDADAGFVRISHSYEFRSLVGVHESVAALEGA